MARLVAAFVTTLLGAAISPRLAAQTSPDHGAFISLIGADSDAVERFTRNGQTLVGEYMQRDGGRVNYTAQLRPDHSVAQFDFTNSARGLNTRTGTAVFSRRSVSLTVTARGKTSTDQLVTTGMPMPGFPPSLVLYEQMVRAASPLPDTGARITMFVARSLGISEIVIRRIGADSVGISVALTYTGGPPGDVEIRAAVSSSGDFTGAIYVRQGKVIRRVERRREAADLVPDTSAYFLVPDPQFNVRVARPAFTSRHARVFIDSFLFDSRTGDGWLKPFGELMTNDGFLLTSTKWPSTPEELDAYNIVVLNITAGPQLSATDCAMVREWVSRGGGLFLITDHGNSETTPCVAKGFGIDIRNTSTIDRSNYEKLGNPGWLIFSRDNGLLRDHPITRGRDRTESINRVTTFTGTSLTVPEASTAFLQLSDSALDRIGARSDSNWVSAAGRAQGVALRFGKGRVVVLGERRVMTAFVEKDRGQQPRLTGMNFPGSDNRQLAMNIMHWLSGLLD